MALSNASKAGVAIFVGAVQFSFGVVLAEIYYPDYNVSTNRISDLGAYCPTTGACVVNQPSATIFDVSVILLGLLVLIGAYFFQRAFRWKPGTSMLALMAIGAVGVGVFPETTGDVHLLFSLIAFLFAGLSALVVARSQRKPMFYFSIILGLATLVALLLYFAEEYAGLGPGGMERMIMYPVLLWAIGYGGHLMATDETLKA